MVYCTIVFHFPIVIFHLLVSYMCIAFSHGILDAFPLEARTAVAYGKWRFLAKMAKGSTQALLFRVVVTYIGSSAQIVIWKAGILLQENTIQSRYLVRLTSARIYGAATYWRIGDACRSGSRMGATLTMSAGQWTSMSSRPWLQDIGTLGWYRLIG